MHPGFNTWFDLASLDTLAHWGETFQTHGFQRDHICPWMHKGCPKTCCIICSLPILSLNCFFFMCVCFVIFQLSPPLFLDISLPLFLNCMSSLGLSFDTMTVSDFLYPLNHSWFFLYVQADLRTIENYHARHSWFIILVTSFTQGTLSSRQIILSWVWF